MKQWISDYICAQKATHDSIPVEAVATLIETLRRALNEDRQIFVFGNGGSAANASHFATDLGKGASDKLNPASIPTTLPSLVAVPKDGRSADSSAKPANRLDGASRRFRVLSLTDNVAWMTALGNDYAYEEVFVRQLMNYGRPGDIALSLSVSGNSPNCVKALEWAKHNGLVTVALVGAKRGRMAEIAEQVLVIKDTHYGRVEDAHMGICHLLCYAFMEKPELIKC